MQMIVQYCIIDQNSVIFNTFRYHTEKFNLVKNLLISVVLQGNENLGSAFMRDLHFYLNKWIVFVMLSFCTNIFILTTLSTLEVYFKILPSV